MEKPVRRERVFRATRSQKPKITPAISWISTASAWRLCRARSKPLFAPRKTAPLSRRHVIAVTAESCIGGRPSACEVREGQPGPHVPPGDRQYSSRARGASCAVRPARCRPRPDLLLRRNLHRPCDRQSGDQPRQVAGGVAPKHYAHEETTVLETIAKMSPGLSSFAGEM